jgi:hypothetical protein
MKASVLKAQITVPQIPKILALCIALLDPIYSGDRNRIIKMLVAYYGVEV